MDNQQARAKAYSYAALALRQFLENGGIEEELYGNMSTKELYFHPSTIEERKKYHALIHACELVIEELNSWSKHP